MNDRDFLAAFEACAIAASDFHHADHVRVAWIYLQEYPLLKAIERFTMSLKRFANHHGVTGIYHETITWAYLLVIHERMQRDNTGLGWEHFCAANSDLFARSPAIIERYYSRETLSSDLARRTFVLPDCGELARRSALSA
jgi:hypothetical protein